MDDRFSPRSARSDEALAQTLHDPMFEPQASYNFADSGEDRHGMHETMGSPDAPNQQSFFNPVNGTSFDPDFSFHEGDNQFVQDSTPFGQPFNPGNLWQDNGTPGGGLGGSFPDANAMQQIVQNRRSVKQQFGQITPPDDTVSEFAPKPTSAEAAVSQAAERAKSDKSERARNAANQRHAKTKKMRKDSQESNLGDSDIEGETGDKKERYREKNRLAAAKCRAKKKENIEDIEVKHRKLSAMNSSLKKQVQDLRGELTGLRTHALNHQDCNCQIARYNINQAKRVAMGVESAPSPTMGFGGSGGSLSYLRSPPGMGGMSPQLNSFANPSPFAFASVTTPNDMGGMQNQEGSPHFGDYIPNDFGGQGFSQP